MTALVCIDIHARQSEGLDNATYVQGTQATVNITTTQTAAAFDCATYHHYHEGQLKEWKI